jgi:glycosyltransferase involved in cell wall biosynthesis
MRCGVPVITADVTSMPEVGGEAAVFVDPFNVDSISAAMISIQNDEKLRSQLSVSGIERSNEFSWEKTSEKLWNAILKASDNH